MPPHATDCPDAAAMRQPSAPPWEVADIFRLYGATYRRTHPVPPAHQQVMHAIESLPDGAARGARRTLSHLWVRAVRV